MAAPRPRAVGEDRDLDAVPEIPKENLRGELRHGTQNTRLVKFASSAGLPADRVAKLATSEDYGTILQEVRILHLLNPHPHVVELLGEVSRPGQYGYCMPVLIDGESLIRGLSSEDRAEYAPSFAHHLCLAVAHCHRNGIIHGDIKMPNTLFDGHTLKLADFDSATLKGEGNKVITTSTTRAPEMFCRQTWSYPIDVWAVGVCAFQMFAGYPPFEWDPDTATLMFLVVGLPSYGAEHYKLDPLNYPAPGTPIYGGIGSPRAPNDPVLKALINRALHVLPERRPVAQEMVELFSGRED